jgi:hypothetical protein
VKEQSHKSEMSAALRGDFERLRARRGEPVEETLQLPRPEPVEAPPPVPAAAEATPEAAPAAAPEPAPELPPAAIVEPDVEAVPEPASGYAEPERRSWLDRLRGR